MGQILQLMKIAFLVKNNLPAVVCVKPVMKLKPLYQHVKGTFPAVVCIKPAMELKPLHPAVVCVRTFRFAKVIYSCKSITFVTKKYTQSRQPTVRTSFLQLRFSCRGLCRHKPLHQHVKLALKSYFCQFIACFLCDKTKESSFFVQL